MAFKKWRGKGESFRVDRYRCIEGRCLHQIIMSAKTKVTKTKTTLKQETCTGNLSDLKHDLHCGFVELGARLGLGLIVTNAIVSSTPKLSKFVTIAPSLSSSWLIVSLIWAPSFCLRSNVFFFAWPSSGQVRSGQVRSGQVRSGQVKSGQVRPGQARPGHVYYSAEVQDHLT
jgi:hypothetical protein